MQIYEDTPGFEYYGQETNAIWHEDREIAGIMYRATNATFNEAGDGQWTQRLTTQPSYCMAQNTDGSISYLYMPAGQTGGWPATAWQSADVQEYYAVNYGLNAADSGPGNTTALQNAVNAIQGKGGGTLRLPAGTFKLAGKIVITGSTNFGIVIQGFSAETTLIQTDSSSDIFDISNTNSGSATIIKDLTLQYAPMTPNGTLVAVNVSYASRVWCEHVTFINFPMSFQAEVHSEQSGLFECYISYDLRTAASGGTPVNGQTMVTLQGAEDFVSGCVIYQLPVDNSPNPGPSNCTGIVLSGQSNGRFITDTHIADLSTGILITGGGIVGVFCSDLLINAYITAVAIQGGNAGVNDIHFTGCTFAASHNTPGTTSGVTISTVTGATVSPAGIYFANCSAYGFGNAGIEIDSGQNIVITGGQYSSNGQNPAAGEQYIAAGIAVLGGTDITITGADCSGVNGVWAGESGAVTQPYGITVAGPASDVLVTGCNLKGNAQYGLYVYAVAGENVPANILVRDCDATGYSSYSAAINVATTVTSVQVTNCAGYNGVSTTALATAAPSGPFYSYTFGYYGPTSFYVGVNNTVTAILINGIATGLKTGAFYLAPGQSAQIEGTGPTPFQMIAQ